MAITDIRQYVHLTEADIEELRGAGFSDIEILDANNRTAHLNYTNRVANGLGLLHDAVVEERTLDDADPLWLENAVAQETVGPGQRNLPPQTSRLGRERNHGHLGKRRQDVRTPQHEDGSPLVGCCESEPGDIPALDQGNSGSPSSPIGP